MSLTTRTDDGWGTTRFVVLGFGTAGYACTDSLLQAGAGFVTALDDRDNEALREKAQILETLGATIKHRIRDDNPADPEYYLVLQDPEGNEFCIS